MINGFPHCVVIDKKGTIRYFNLAGRGLHQAIARINQEK